MRLIWTLGGAGFVLAAATAAADVDTGSPIAAVWKEQHLSFFHMGRTSLYSCNGLRDKVRAILWDLGARRDLRITALGCEQPVPRVQLGAIGPSLNIVFSSPALPDAKLKPLHSGDLEAVDARFERFSIANDTFRNMGVTDCELVEEFSHQILPKLATRNVKQDIRCVPFQQNGARFMVQGEILKQVPADVSMTAPPR